MSGVKPTEIHCTFLAPTSPLPEHEAPAPNYRGWVSLLMRVKLMKKPPCRITVLRFDRVIAHDAYPSRSNLASPSN